jgi:hypothetical protein
MACPMRKYIAAVSVFAALIAALASFFSLSSDDVNDEKRPNESDGEGVFMRFKTRVRVWTESTKWYVRAKTSALFGRFVGVWVKKVS